ncbi:MAG: MBL fold metallo-hydrolase [Chloroflexi bacterium]|nr:MBL fold metallo-hydrolase [Chloroflexota bacterium]
MNIRPTIEQLPNIRAGVFLLHANRPVLIDTGMRGQGRRLISALHQRGLRLEDLAVIVLTHWHIDHTGGLRVLGRYTHAPVACHEADVPYITGAIKPVKPRAGTEAGRFGRWLLTKLFQPHPIDVVLHDGEEVPEINGLYVVSTPGHTPGHVCYYYEPLQALFAGDALVNRNDKLGFAPESFSVDSVQARQSIEKLRRLSIAQCYFGHGMPILEQAHDRIEQFVTSAHAEKAEQSIN